MRNVRSVRGVGRRGSQRRGSPWPALLVGPLVGYGYFWLAYLLAETSCSTSVALLGPAALRGSLLSTAAVALLLLSWWARRGRTNPPSNGSALDAPDGELDNFVRFTGRVLLGLFALFVVAVSVPLAGAGLC